MFRQSTAIPESKIKSQKYVFLNALYTTISPSCNLDYFEKNYHWRETSETSILYITKP